MRGEASSSRGSRGSSATLRRATDVRRVLFVPIRCSRLLSAGATGDGVYHGDPARDDRDEEVFVFEVVAPGLARLGILFVNVFALGEPGRPWLLVDTGLSGSARLIRRAVAGRFGEGARPEGVVLTHGHF